MLRVAAGPSWSGRFDTLGSSAVRHVTFSGASPSSHGSCVIVVRVGGERRAVRFGVIRWAVRR